MISLDEEIKKDKDRERNHNPRGYNHRRGRNFHHNENYRHHPRRLDPRNSEMIDERLESRHSNRANNRFEANPTKMILKINNLHYSVTKEQLQGICEQIGKVKSCRILWDKSGRSNEKATVEYFEQSDAEKAVNELRGKVIEEQAIQTELEEVTNRMPGKRHQIKRNYHGNHGGNSRFRYGNGHKKY